MEFEWDPGKAQSNVKKHGVDFAEAKTVFNDPLEVTIRDTAHSSQENRFLSMGTSEAGKLTVVYYTERSDSRIRLIGARRASPKERRQYE